MENSKIEITKIVRTDEKGVEVTSYNIVIRDKNNYYVGGMEVNSEQMALLKNKLSEYSL